MELGHSKSVPLNEQIKFNANPNKQQYNEHCMNEEHSIPCKRQQNSLGPWNALVENQFVVFLPLACLLTVCIITLDSILRLISPIIVSKRISYFGSHRIFRFLHCFRNFLILSLTNHRSVPHFCPLRMNCTRTFFRALRKSHNALVRKSRPIDGVHNME